MHTNIAELILSALAQDDAQTSAQLVAVTGLTLAVVALELAALVELGVVATSGRTSGTRYVLAVDEEALAPTPIEVTDLISALAEMGRRVAAGQTIQTIRAGAAEWQAETLRELAADPKLRGGDRVGDAADDAARLRLLTGAAW